MVIYRENKEGGISEQQAAEAVRGFFAQNDYSGKRLLILVPDNTRSGPIGEVFQMIFDCIGAEAAALDILVALGTHQPMSEEQICQRLAITLEERKAKYGEVKFFNHEWEKPETFTNLGTISADEIGEISGGLFYEEVPIAINKMIYDYDEFFILGPVFPFIFSTGWER